MLDITFDLETCALCPTAAVMSIGAMAWDRNNIKTPFFQLKENVQDPSCSFACHIDLRGMFVNNFTFDSKTAEWWETKSDDVKASVLSSDGYDLPCRPIEVAVKDFFDWIEDVKKDKGEKDIYLWSQGSDFDIAILRNICYKYHIDFSVNYTHFRDHRTFYLEGARIICNLAEDIFDEKDAYKLVDEYEGKGSVHEPIYDCQRSIYSTWQMMKHLQCLKHQG